MVCVWRSAASRHRAEGTDLPRTSSVAFAGCPHPTSSSASLCPALERTRRAPHTPSAPEVGTNEQAGP